MTHRYFKFIQDNDTDYPQWEDRKLSDILSKYTDTIIYVNDDTVYDQVTVSTSKGVISRGKILGSKIGRKRQFVVDTDKYPDTLTFTRQSVMNGGIGFVNKKLNGSIVTENMPLFDLNTNLCNREFLAQFVNSSYYYENIIFPIKPTGSAQLSVHEKEWLKRPIPLPELPEQEKIANFFSALDERIEFQSQKINLLKEQKRGYLQQVFSRELVFADDNGNEYPEWEEKKLGDIIDNGKSGGTPTASDKSYYSGEEANIPFLGISDMTEQGKYISKTSKKITKSGLDSSSAWIVPTGYLVYAMYASVGKVGILRQDAATSQAVFCMNFRDEALLEYVYYFLGHFRDNGQLNSLITTGTQGNINAKTLKNISVPLPNLSEQEKITEFFSALDENIELNEQKLGLLKEQKKGYLQGIFGM